MTSLTHLPTRRRCLLQGLAAGSALAMSATGFPVRAAMQDNLPLSVSLSQELTQALAKDFPLIVMVSLPGCPFCHAARRSHLLPMLREGVPLVQVDMNSPLATLDFAGQKVTHEQLVHKWRVPVAPTLLFFGPRGREAAERMEGSYLPDFYGAYLEGRIQAARGAIKSP